MQNEDGSLNYVSRLPLAVESGASWGDPARNQRLRALNERGELHTVAEISCLRDQLLIQNDPALSLRRGTWIDLPMRYMPYKKLNDLLIRMFIH